LIFVDSNVLIDLVTDDPTWAEWSDHQLDVVASKDELAINSVVYAELSISFARIEQVDAFVEAAGLSLVDIPRAALFLAGKAFRTYRAKGGAKSGVLPDFFIGAHAAVVGATLLTRDVSRYRRYFPRLTLIAPTP
jgi:predicted nucleic acid-binding protein